MKRFILLLIILCATVSINAQNSIRSSSQSTKGEEQANLLQWRGELQQVMNAMNNRLEELERQEAKTRVAVAANQTGEENDLFTKISDIENQIESTKAEIHSIYLNYSEQSLFLDKKSRQKPLQR